MANIINLTITDKYYELTPVSDVDLHRFDKDTLLGLTKEQFKEVYFDYLPNHTNEDYNLMWYDCFLKHPRNKV